MFSLLQSSRGLFKAIMRGRQCDECYTDRKVMSFFKKATVVLGNFKSYLSLWKSPEIMTLSV